MSTMLELLRQHGIEFHEYGDRDHHVSKGWVNVDCVYCSPAARMFRLGYHLYKRYWHCWYCGPHPFTGTLAKVLGVPYKAAQGLSEGLGSLRGMTEASRGILELPYNLGPLLPQHKLYLSKRGFDPTEIETLWKIKGIGISRSLAWRIFIPAYLADQIVSWTTRSISDDTKMRYVSAKKSQESYPLKELLYGEQHCGHCIIINEGPLDAWAIGPGGVATCGVGYSRSQLLRMSMYPVRVIAFDNEPKAQERARRLAADLSVFEGETHIAEWETAKDASRVDKHEIKELRRRFL